MQIAMVGLGRMGANMTRRLLQGGHQVVATDRDAKAVASVAAEHRQPTLLKQVDRLCRDGAG